MEFSNRLFSYDGTFEGFMCATVRCISMRIVPRDIRAESDHVVIEAPEEYSFVRTDYRIADRMYRYIGLCSSPEVQQLSLDCFLTGLPYRERDLYLMICRAIKFGAEVGEDFVNPVTQHIQMAVRDLYREAQTCAAELLFDKEGDLAVTGIRPRNRILPLMRKMVLSNPELDDFLVYDDRHKMLFMRSGPEDHILDVSYMKASGQELDREERYRRLWAYFADGSHIRTLPKLEYRGADALAPMWYIAG